MKIGILTFHRSHNYGSMLQAYALQQILLRAGHECETIDFSSPRQKEMYALPWNRGHWIKKILKKVYYLSTRKGLKTKFQLFEEFLYQYIKLSPQSYEYTSELANLDYDVIITGSDQIWNVSCYDFDWAYYIDFPFEGKRISYAVSMGSGRCKQIMETQFKEKLSSLLDKYHSIIVRETGTKNIVKEISGLYSTVGLDPTLLLGSNEWEELAGNKPLVEGDYIFYYTPQYRSDAISCVERIGIQTGMPIIETLHIKNRHRQNFRLNLNVGPKEFLNLIRYAKIIVGASFHVIVFSILFKKTFWAVDSLNDNRKSSLLRLLQLEDRNIAAEFDLKQITNDKGINYKKTESLLSMQKEQSLKLLFEAISI